MAKLTNRYNRYDAESQLWIEARKRIFLYWFRYLQEAEASPDYEVDWRCYDAWGGRAAVYPPRSGDFDEFWQTSWKTLFGMPTRDSTPLFPLSIRNTQADHHRATLLVYQISRTHPQKTNIQVLDEVRARIPDDCGSRYLLNLKRLAVDPGQYEYAARTISRLRRGAQDRLQSVCRGQFP